MRRKHQQAAGEAAAVRAADPGKPVLMGWLPNGAYSKDIYLTDTEGPVQATDIFGGKQTLKIQGEGDRRRVSLWIRCRVEHSTKYISMKRSLD